MNSRIALAVGVAAWMSMSMAYSQSYTEEALMVSRTQVGGTARIQAIGGAQVALGGDLSLAYSNPAGLGMYNRSEATLSPAMAFTNYASSYLGGTTNASLSTPMISHLGVGFHADQDGRKGLWGGTLGISFNRINDFNQSFSYSGNNPNSTLIDYFIINANGQPESNFSYSGSQFNTPTGLAYSNYLINPQSVLTPPGPDTLYFSVIQPPAKQSESVKVSGAQNQWSISYGLNFNDKIFVGAGLGIVTLKYAYDKRYREQFDPGQPMRDMQLNESLSLNGTGINATLGAIFRPLSALQLGLSVATPTAMEIEEAYNANMSTVWDSTQYANGTRDHYEYTDNVTTNYSISTPWKISSGVAYFFGKHGFITADVEWLSYGKTRYSSDDPYINGSNDIINNTYQSTFNLRFGGEYRLNNFRLRAGYNFMPDPHRTSENNVNRDITSISGGLGYRTAKFYVDLAVISTRGNTSYRPYQAYYPQDPLVTQSKQSTQVMITVGLPF